MLKRRTVVELWDDSCPGEPGDYQEVFWLSQHELEAVQEEVIYCLHDVAVRIRHINVYFRSAIDMANIIKYYAKIGTVYVVVPKQLQDRAFEMGIEGLEFRTFCGTKEQDGAYTFKCVYKKVDGEQTNIFSIRDLENIRQRGVL